MNRMTLKQQTYQSLTSMHCGTTTNNYTVTFDGNEGNPLSESDQAIAVTFDSTYGALPKPTMKGHTFTGWLYSETNEVIRNTTTVNITENITLVAKWVAINHTATLYLTMELK